MQAYSEFIKRNGFSDYAEIKLLPEYGSDRKFYRVIEGNKTAILIEHSGITGFDDYIVIDKFLQKIGIAVPKIYDYDKDKQFILEEDIGDLNLQEAILTEKYEVLPTYKSVIDVLLKMQIEGGEKIHLCQCSFEGRKFDYDALRWETDYFAKYFLGLFCKVEARHTVILKEEFHTLASKLINETLYFMHRDFQSQNIFIKDGKIRIIDFQSAKQGLLAYDLASLLKDAYVEERIGMQYIESLLNYYIDSLKDWKIEISPDKFKQVFLYAGLQRNMQALGAFSFLSLVKGKKQFKKYIPSCLKYLKSALSETNEFPELKNLVGICLPKSASQV